jgi:hypothetical protein
MLAKLDLSKKKILIVKSVFLNSHKTKEYVLLFNKYPSFGKRILPLPDILLEYIA